MSQMKNPKEKALELVDKYRSFSYSIIIELQNNEVKYFNGLPAGTTAKQCALIAVEEQLKLIDDMIPTLSSEFKDLCLYKAQELLNIKSEIEKL